MSIVKALNIVETSKFKLSTNKGVLYLPLVNFSKIHLNFCGFRFHPKLVSRLIWSWRIQIFLKKLYHLLFITTANTLEIWFFTIQIKMRWESSIFPENWILWLQMGLGTSSGLNLKQLFLLIFKKITRGSPLPIKIDKNKFLKINLIKKAPKFEFVSLKKHKKQRFWLLWD